MDKLSELSEIILQTSVQAAIKSTRFIGSGEKNAADQAAVLAMQGVLRKQNIFTGTVVIGEGERDEAPMLFIGEKLGNGDLQIDIAVDPLEGTNLCANNLPNSITAIAFGESGTLLYAPDVYMEKIASKNISKGIISLDKSPSENVKDLAKVLNKEISDMNIVILERDRHKNLINEIRSIGAKVSLIQDGDLSAIIYASREESDVDMYIGSGGAPEGVLSACALKIIGGYMEGKLVLDTKEKEDRAIKMGLEKDKKLLISDMVKGNVIFCITGVTDGNLLKGVKIKNGKVESESLILNSFDRTERIVRMISDFI